MRESQRTSPMNFQFPMVQARAASADGLSSRCGLVRESDGNSPFGKKRSNPAARRGGIGSACTFPARTYLESSVRLLWQNPISPGAVTRRQPFPVQNRSKSEACGPSRNGGGISGKCLAFIEPFAVFERRSLVPHFHNCVLQADLTPTSQTSFAISTCPLWVTQTMIHFAHSASTPSKQCTVPVRWEQAT